MANGGGTYADELHQLFPNGFHASAQHKEPEVELLIDIFDNASMSNGSKVNDDEGARSLLDDILSGIDPSLADRKPKKREELLVGHSDMEPTEDPPTSVNYAAASTSASPMPVSPTSDSSEARSTPSTSVSPPAIPSTITTTNGSTTASNIRNLAGRAVARKYDVYTGEDRATIVMNPVLVPKGTPSPSLKRAAGPAVSPSTVRPGPSSGASSAATTPSPRRRENGETITHPSSSPQRFMSIAGRSARDQAQAQAQAEAEAEKAAAFSQADGRLQGQTSLPHANGKRSVFNQITIRNSSAQSSPPVSLPHAPEHAQRRAYPHHRSTGPVLSDRSSSEEGSPPMQRGGSRGSQYPAGRRSLNGGGLRDARGSASYERRMDYQTPHQWTPDPASSQHTRSKTTLRYTQGAPRQREERPDRTEASFTGYQNGWKSLPNPAVLDVRGGRTLNESNAAELERLNAIGGGEAGPDPFHWTGSGSEQTGRGRLIGKGALGSRAGGYQSRSDERFAASTAALEQGIKEGGSGSSREAPAARIDIDEKLEAMDPWKASWEVQRRTIAGPMNARNRRVAQAQVA